MPARGRAEKFDVRPALAEEPAEVVPPDAYLWDRVHEPVLGVSQQGTVVANVKRVDWTTLLPVEVLLEVRKRTQNSASFPPLSELPRDQICSHLLPSSLWQLAFVNKRMYAALTSDSGAAMWRHQLESPANDPYHGRSSNFFLNIFLGFQQGRSDEDTDDEDADTPSGRKKAREKRQLPLEDGKPIKPLKVSALYFAETCQVRSRRPRIHRRSTTLNLHILLDLRQAYRLPEFRLVGACLLRLPRPRSCARRRGRQQSRPRRPAPVDHRTRQDNET